MVASNEQLLSRLVGLETEYALRLSRGDSLSSTRFHRYQQVVRALGRRVPTAPARHFKDGVFTANGGAVWFESERPAAGAGLIEGSTPECRSPREALIYQRAQDRLLEEAAADPDAGDPLVLLKNDRDACDNVYGAQENYEVVMASGWSLLLWRVGLVLLFPLLLATWVGFLATVVLLFVYFFLAMLIYGLGRALGADHQRLALALFGKDLATGHESGGPTPVWMESTLLWATRILTAPLALAMMLLAQATIFRAHRRQLVPFLISRVIIAGAGMIDREGKFHLADKAPAVNCVLGVGGYLFDRPIIMLGHFFKALCVEVCFAPREFGDLFAERQRLQLGLGDSNMSETAEYLRVGTTMLVLDAIEAGAVPPIPALRRPIHALHRFCADPTLQQTMPLNGGKLVSALDLQQFYFQACRRFLESREGVPAEAWQILQLWEEMLNGLEELRSGTEHAEDALLGRIDWVTKKFLLDGAGEDADWSARKKIDIRYHELSRDGYFRILVDAGLAMPLVSDEELERARRMPPARSPATMRGHYIREFSASEQGLQVNWKRVVLGRGTEARTIRLARYQASCTVPDESSEPPRAPWESNLHDEP